MNFLLLRKENAYVTLLQIKCMSGLGFTVEISSYEIQESDQEARVQDLSAVFAITKIARKRIEYCQNDSLLTFFTTYFYISY